jgi:hypothetical protein
MKRFDLLLPPEDWEGLIVMKRNEERAKKERVAIAELIRRFIRAGLAAPQVPAEPQKEKAKT